MRSELRLGLAMTVLTMLGGSAFAAGDAAKGKAAFTAKCAICHQKGLGANPFVGPELKASWDATPRASPTTPSIPTD
jgi:cytochrome c2